MISAWKKNIHWTLVDPIRGKHVGWNATSWLLKHTLPLNKGCRVMLQFYFYDDYLLSSWQVYPTISFQKGITIQIFIATLSFMLRTKAIQCCELASLNLCNGI